MRYLIHNWNWRTFASGFWLAVLLGLFIIGVPAARPDLDNNDFQAIGAARDHLFDFVEWEADALFDKATSAAFGPQRYMTEDERIQYVHDYLQLVYDIAQLEDQVNAIYVDPGIEGPETASAELRAKRDSMRIEQESRQALAEAIIQSQISEMLVEYGFDIGGQVFPPVGIRFTQLPTILIVSPRDHIERIGAYPLEHGLTVDQKESVESQVDESLDVSSLIVPLGGLAVYPAMLIETGYAPHVFDIGAHEWTHHYLAFFPLGFNYGVTPELYTMNETVASIVGEEMAWAVLDRYYPDLAPPPPDYAPQPTVETPTTDAETPVFDFRAEMHETRIHTDELLAAGEINEAERYMEERRIMFVKNGYSIRKLNQAYFAFYGAYADQPGATGSDPVGPALRELRYYSNSLYDYVAAVRGMTTFEDVLSTLEEARAEAGG